MNVKVTLLWQGALLALVGQQESTARTCMEILAQGVVAVVT